MGRIKKKLEEKIIKVYDQKDAPEGAILVSRMIERNGIVDLSLKNKKILKPNERIVYIYKIPIPDAPTQE